jgi:hypothetical protein
LALERITVLTRDRAEQLGITVTVKPSGFRLTEEGSAGPVFGTLTDKLAELGSGKRLQEVSISKSITGEGTAGLRTLLSVLPMLPKLDFSVRVSGSGEFPDLSGGVEVAYLAGPSSSFRRVEKDLLGLLDRASDLTLEMTISYAPEGGAEVDGAAWKTIAETLTDIKPGEIRVEVSGS